MQIAPITARVRERAAAYPERLALEHAGRRTSYGELYERVGKIAGALERLGLAPGDVVLAWLPNCVEAVECELAVLGAGLVWVTLTARLTWAEVRGVILAARPRVLILSPELGERMRQGAGELPLDDPPPIVVTGAPPSAPPGARSLEALLASAPSRAPLSRVDSEAPARLRYTSGTTGEAKAAVLPHRVYHAQLDNLLDVVGPFTARDVALHVAPLTHGAGGLVYPLLHEGGTQLLHDHFDAEQVLALIESRRVTTLFTVPTMLARLVAAPGFGGRDLSSLRALVYGGAPMPEAPLLRAVERLGPVLVHIFGMSEAPWPIAALRAGEHVPGSARLRSVGRASPGCELRVVGPGGEPLAPGERGEIELRGSNVMTGYLDDAEATRAAFHDGWLRSGDLGTLSGDGTLHIVGRSKDVIISGGFNVYAAEVEAVLSEHPAVLEVAVVGLPHDDWGEQVAAFVVPREGAVLEPGALEALARARLSGYKCPRRIEVVPELAKNPSGKLQKPEIVRRALDRPA